MGLDRPPSSNLRPSTSTVRLPPLESASWSYDARDDDGVAVARGAAGKSALVAPHGAYCERRGPLVGGLVVVFHDKDCDVVVGRLGPKCLDE